MLYQYKNVDLGIGHMSSLGSLESSQRSPVKLGDDTYRKLSFPSSAHVRSTNHCSLSLNLNKILSCFSTGGSSGTCPIDLKCEMNGNYFIGLANKSVWFFP